MSIVKNEKARKTPEDSQEHIVTQDSNTISQQSSHKSLEDEIYYLRNKMEQAVWQEHSMTSDLVVNISSKLDLKINEYMKKQRLSKGNNTM